MGNLLNICEIQNIWRERKSKYSNHTTFPILKSFFKFAALALLWVKKKTSESVRFRKLEDQSRDRQLDALSQWCSWWHSTGEGVSGPEIQESSIYAQVRWLFRYETYVQIKMVEAIISNDQALKEDHHLHTSSSAWMFLSKSSFYYKIHLLCSEMIKQPEESYSRRNVKWIFLNQLYFPTYETFSKNHKIPPLKDP